MSPARGHLRLIAPDPSPEEVPRDPEAVFRRYAPYVGSIALRLLGRPDDVDDMVQEVFLQVTKKLGEVRDPAALRGWLASVTVRHVKRRLRARRLKHMLGLDEESDYEEIAGEDASPETRALLTRVYAALDRLPADERIAWTLRHVQGEKLEEIASLCGCSLATAKRRITTAHDELQRLLGHG